MRVRNVIILLLFIVTFAVAGCGVEAEPTAEPQEESTRVAETAVPATDTPEAEPTAEPEAVPEMVELDIKGFLFRPETVTVTLGTAVEWTNLDDIQHTVTSGVPDNPSGDFDSGFFVQNEQFTHTFEEPGEFPFYCQRHPHMQATIVVEE